MILNAHGVQFLSKDFLPNDFNGYGEFTLPVTTNVVIKSTIKKKGLSKRRLNPIFAQPWAEGPSIGAYEVLDPYRNVRWPSYILLEANINLTDVYGDITPDLVDEIIIRLQEFLWGSFDSMPILNTRTDERANCPNCKRVYHIENSDATGNPFKSSACNYYEHYDAVPNGPGLIHIPSIPRTANIPPQIARVWSQSIKFSNKADIKDDIKIKNKVKRIKTHWNAHRELSDAKKYLSCHDIKGTIRSSSSAIEAALKFYCNEWNIKWPSQQGMQFDERIDCILKSGGRTLYSSIDSKASVKLLHLYRARSSMHEGDCYYNDNNTNSDINVNIAIAEDFFNTASEFIIWLDAQM